MPSTPLVFVGLKNVSFHKRSITFVLSNELGTHGERNGDRAERVCMWDMSNVSCQVKAFPILVDGTRRLTTGNNNNMQHAYFEMLRCASWPLNRHLSLSCGTRVGHEDSVRLRDKWFSSEYM